MSPHIAGVCFRNHATAIVAIMTMITIMIFYFVNIHRNASIDVRDQSFNDH